MWFGLAAIALAGAVALLYVDRMQRQRTGQARQIWANAQGYNFNDVDPELPGTWHRASLAKQDYLSAVDIVAGIRRGEKFLLFDLEEAATIVAVRRNVGSEVDIDLRLKTMSPPRDHDLELVGAIGERVLFATDVDIARRVVDQRMMRLTEEIPETLQALWSEGAWTLGSMPVGTSSREWDDAVDAVVRLSGILYQLPPTTEPETLDAAGHDPGRPYPPLVPGEDGALPTRPTRPAVATAPAGSSVPPQAHPEDGPPPVL